VSKQPQRQIVFSETGTQIMSMATNSTNKTLTKKAQIDLEKMTGDPKGLKITSKKTGE